ncbi:MAG TPA: hypothetical protein VGE98_17245 [Thermoanaerobaculia bacterium]
MKNKRTDDQSQGTRRKVAVLHRETLRHLTELQLQGAAGGGTHVGCPTGPTCSGRIPCTCF